jgi:hypothetical protein
MERKTEEAISTGLTLQLNSGINIHRRRIIRRNQNYLNNKFASPDALAAY